ncbi:MAG: NGG1p interacting factor NIF3, partial [Candidatus Hodarchaeales archaeon]
MKVKEFMEKAVSYGIDNDPRGREAIEKILSKNRKKYDKLSTEEKEEFNEESLWNPYSDST